VSQDGFDFGPPPSRREPRRFEPPPWERDQFERHAREQTERERAEREAQAAREAEAAAAGEAAGVVGEAAGGNAEPAIERADAGSAGSAAEAPRGQRPRAHVNSPAGEPAEPAPAPAKEPVDEKEVALMMLELKAQEPAALEGAWKVALASGAVVGLVGLVIGIWGAVGIARLGSAGTVVGMVLIGFGLAFAGIGGWLVFSALRQRGVL
jgi:hypothetical protein